MDVVQFSLIMQRFEQEVGGEQGSAAKQTQETTDQQEFRESCRG